MRETVQSEKSRCQGCSACTLICPKGAIRMEQDPEGFLYPRVDAGLCISCDLCEKRCPSGKVFDGKSTLLGAQCRDSEIRRVSSSGGVFTLLAEEMLSRGGAVFGTVMGEDFRAETVGAISMDGITEMRGSKYVQGQCQEAYGHVRQLCAQGIPVLFTGTPCQVAGLLSLFGSKRPENLITADFICHGTPSPAVFVSYVHALEEKTGSHCLSYEFRNKRLGWKNFSVTAAFEDGTAYMGTQLEDMYMRGFLANLYLRPSCHLCQLRGTGSPADLTLGDLWGAQDICPDRDDDTGLSLLQIHTDRGRKLVDSVELVRFQVPSAEAFLRYNPSIAEPVAPHPRRAAFFRHFAKEGFKFARVEKLLAPPGRLEQYLDRAKRIPAKIGRIVKGDG